ncbi:MAG: NAD-dependent epimerase/dehydratase family protein, partial [Candidatus Adiutrix sp.]
GDFNCETCFSEALSGVKNIVHLAACAHRGTSHKGQNPYETDYHVAVNLAREASLANVSRFVYASSVAVHGRAAGFAENPADETSPINPRNPYGHFKAKAETALTTLAKEAPLGLTILRPAVMYGPGIKGNLRALLALVNRGIPWPLALVNNQRSLLSVSNFVDFILKVLVNPKAIGETFVLADEKNLSTPQIITLMAESLGINPRFWPCPLPILRLGTPFFGREKIQQLIGDLCFDSQKARKLLSWDPPFPPESDFYAMGKYYLNHGGAK